MTLNLTQARLRRPPGQKRFLTHVFPIHMNVTEVESALIALAAAHPTICELITLPNLTIEGRTTHAVRLATQAANTVDAYYLTGGVHAREWGSCEIVTFRIIWRRIVNIIWHIRSSLAAGLAAARGADRRWPGGS